MKTTHRTAFAALGLVLVAGTARAQMPESYRELQLKMLENERTMINHMIDSMPAQFFRDRATPVQRDFGQQLYHCAEAYKMLVPRILGAPAPTFPDTANAFDKTGLRTYVNATYDWAEAFARSEPAADREQTANLFGQQMPKWQVWDELHQHTMWTLGQTVANFRAHGMPPAAFMFF